MINFYFSKVCGFRPSSSKQNESAFAVVSCPPTKKVIKSSTSLSLSKSSSFSKKT